MNKLTLKQKQFCREYIKNFNATQAAIKAGYSKKTASEQASRLLTNVNIQEYLKELLDKAHKTEEHAIADALEVEEFLARVLRGKEETEVVNGKGAKIKVTPTGNEKLKAAELLGKRHSMFTEKLEIIETPIIKDDI